MSAVFILRRTGEQNARERASWAKDTRKYLQQKDRQQLAKLRSAIAEAKKRQREAHRKVVAQCKANRERLRGAVKTYREQERERINAEVEEMRAAARRTCELRKASVRKAGLSVRAQRSAELEAERHLQRELRLTEKHAKRSHDRHKKSAREVAKESDDEVRNNIDPDLVPVFNRVRKAVRPNPRQSRTEAFLQYVEENPQEVVQLQQQSADVEVARLIAEQEQAERDAARHAKRGYRPTRAERREALSAVPF